MQFLEWMASQHIKVVIFALAASLLLPYTLIAAQRPGRGIKPWWTTSRFLSWIGLIGAIFALTTGLFLAKNLGLLNGEWVIRSEWSDLRIHQYLGGATVLLGFLCLRASYLPRREHQGMGPYALIAGLLWAVAAGGAGHYGIKLLQTHRAEGLMLTRTKPESQPSAKLADDTLNPNDANRLLKILDYASLVPMHSEPVRSPAHKNRWIRVWVSQNAVEAYTQGSQLPDESLVVMNTLEDRWGRPGYEIGPLYSLEVLPGGKSVIGMYWSYVPESKRDEVNGATSVIWAEPNSNLASCMECHAEGMSQPRNRSRVIRRPRTETSTENQIQSQNQNQ